ncbi:hypothetical protein CCP3SC1AL1_2190003 [Gammaproteobacteria bacterium]
MKKIIVPIAAFLLGACVSNTLPMAGAEPQPHMTSALNSLQDAREQLQQASRDKGGHREKALEYVNMAIEAVKRGISFDNRNN